MAEHDSPHETSDVSPRLIVYAMVFTAVSVLAGSGVLWLGFQAVRAPQEASPFPDGGSLDVGQPVLQVQPQTDFELLQEQWNRRLRSVGWVDRDTGVVHMPIDRAMKLLVRRGLPAGDQTEAER